MRATVILLFLVALLGLGALLRFSGAGPVPASLPLEITWQVASQAPLIFGVIPYDTDQGLAQEFAPLLRYFRKHLGQEVRLQVAPSYDALGTLLDEGKVEIARFSQVPFETFNAENRWEALCRTIVNGTIYSRGVFVVPAGSTAQTLEELKGKHFAFVDPYSGTGCIRAREFLLGRGLDPITHFGRVSYSGNHQASLSGLRSGLYDGAVVYENALPQSEPATATGSASTGFRRLGHTDWVLTDPFVVRRDMPPERKSALRDLFVHIREREGGAEAADELRTLRHCDGFIAETDVASFPPPPHD